MPDRDAILGLIDELEQDLGRARSTATQEVVSGTLAGQRRERREQAEADRAALDRAEGFRTDNADLIQGQRDIGMGGRLAQTAGMAGGRLVSAVADVAGRASEAITGRRTGASRFADRLAESIQRVDTAQAIAREEGDVSGTILGGAKVGVERTLDPAVRSLSDLVVGGALGRMVRIGGQAGTIANFALQAGTQARRQALEAGLAPLEADAFGVVSAAIEGGITAAFSRWAHPGLESLMGRGGLQGTRDLIARGTMAEIAKRGGVATLAELTEEGAIELANAFAEQLSKVDPAALDADSLRQRAVDTFMATIATMGIGNAPASVAGVRDRVRARGERIDAPSLDAVDDIVQAPGESLPDRQPDSDQGRQVGPDLPSLIAELEPRPAPAAAPVREPPEEPEAAPAPVDGEATGEVAEPPQIDARSVQALADEMSDTLGKPVTPAEAQEALARIDEQDVAEALPGARVERTEDGFVAEMPTGALVGISFREQVGSQEERVAEVIAQAKARGEKISRAKAAERAANADVPGLYLSTEGRSVNIAGLMALDRGKADTGTLNHEAFHVLQAMGVFQEQDLQALDAAIQEGRKPEAPQLLREAWNEAASGTQRGQEEAYARAMEHLVREAEARPPWWRRIIDGIRRLLGLKPTQGRRQQAASAAVQQVRETARGRLEQLAAKRRQKAQEAAQAENLPPVAGRTIAPAPAAQEAEEGGKPALPRLKPQAQVAKEAKAAKAEEDRLAAITEEARTGAAELRAAEAERTAPADDGAASAAGRLALARQQVEGRREARQQEAAEKDRRRQRLAEARTQKEARARQRREERLRDLERKRGRRATNRSDPRFSLRDRPDLRDAINGLSPAARAWVMEQPQGLVDLIADAIRQRPTMNDAKGDLGNLQQALILAQHRQRRIAKGRPPEPSIEEMQGSWSKAHLATSLDQITAAEFGGLLTEAEADRLRRGAVMLSMAQGAPSSQAEGLRRRLRFMKEQVDKQAETDRVPRFSLRSPRQGPALVAMHNLSEESLLYADRLGGLAVPSIAVLPAGEAIENGAFGGITLIGGRELGNPERVPVFDSDAYTARFPEPEYAKAKTKDADSVVASLRPFEKEFGGAPSHEVFDDMLRGQPGRAIDAIIRSNAGKAWFLRSEGEKDVAPVMADVEPSFAWTDVSPLKEALDSVDVDGWNKLGAMHPKNIQTRKDLREPFIQAIKKWSSDSGLESEDGDFMATQYASDDTELPYAVVEKLLDDRRNRGKREVDVHATRAALEERIGPRAAAFKAWVESKILPAHGAPMIRIGRKREPYTLDAIVRFMKRARGVKGVEEAATFGEGATRAAAAKRFRSLEEMRRAAGEQILSGEALEKARESAKQKTEAYRMAVLPFYGIKTWRGTVDTWSALDDSMRVLADIAANPSESAARAALKRRDFDGVSEELVSQAVEAARAMVDAPVPYFEAKPQRAVDLGEFAGAVVPRGASPELMAVLRRHGLEVQEYDGSAGDVGNRQAIRELEERLERSGRTVRFSLDDTERSDGDLGQEGRRTNPGRDDRERAIVDLFDSISPIPERQEMAELERQANARLQGIGYEEARKRLLDDAFDLARPTDVIMAQKVVQRALGEASRSGMRSPEAMKEALQLVAKYREMGSEQARAFAARRDQHEGPVDRNRRLLFEQLVMPPRAKRSRINRLRRLARENGDAKALKRAKEIEQQWIDSMERKVLRPLRMKYGIDLGNLRSKVLADPAAVARMFSLIGRLKADGWGALEEYYYNSILSNPATHAINFGGNMLHGFYSMGVERAIETAVGLIPGFNKDTDRARLGEWKHALSGLMRGTSEGFRNMFMAYKTELPYFDKIMGVEMTDKTDNFDEGPKIGGLTAVAPQVREESFIGRILGPARPAVNAATRVAFAAANPVERVAGRALRATGTTTMMALDELSKTMFANWSVFPHAYRIALNEGRKGRGLEERVAQLISDRASPAWMQSVDFAKEVSFQNKGDAVVRFLTSLRNLGIPENDIPLFRLFGGMKPLILIVPFIKTPWNVFKKALQLGPLSAIGTAGDLSSMLLGRGTPPGAAKRLARTVIFGAALYALLPYLMGEDDDEDPVATGTRGGWKPGETETTERSRPSMSLNLTKLFGVKDSEGGTVWMEYRRADPFAQPLALLVDMVNAGRKAVKTGGSVTEGSTLAAIGTLIKAPLEGTMLSGVSDFLDVMKEGADGDFGAVKRWAARIPGSFVPNIIRGVLRDSRGDFDETRVWMSPDGKATYTDRIVENTQLLGGGAFSKRDAWGRVRSRWGNAQVGALWFNTINPLRLRGTGKEELPDAMNGVVSRVNAVAEKQRWPSRPNPWYVKDGQRVYLTEQQYDDMQAAGGAFAQKLAAMVNIDLANPQVHDRDAVLQILSDARGRSTDELKRTWEGVGGRSEAASEVWLMRQAIKMRRQLEEARGAVEKDLDDRYGIVEKNLNKAMSQASAIQRALAEGRGSSEAHAATLGAILRRSRALWLSSAERLGLPDLP